MKITQKLEPKFKEQWLAALRSGRYVQATGVLCTLDRQDDKHHMCCLGVAEHICGTSPEEMGSSLDITMPYDLANPKSPRFLFSPGDDGEGSLGDYLASMNDGSVGRNIERHSFEEIADWIEENL